MLVLSRRPNEKVLFAGLGISVEVVRVNGHAVRLGIQAPSDVRVVRNELVENESLCLKRADRSQFPQQIAERLRSRLQIAANELCELHERLEGGDADAEPAIFRVFQELKSLDEELQSSTESSRPCVPSRRQALIIDDNDNESRLLAGFLRCRNIDVQVASNGENALNYLRSSALPDWVLLDLIMPEFDGRWTIKHIREDPRFQELQVFAVSGSDPTDFGIELGSGGVNRWLRKPLDPETLLLRMSQDEEPCAMAG